MDIQQEYFGKREKVSRKWQKVALVWVELVVYHQESFHAQVIVTTGFPFSFQAFYGARHRQWPAILENCDHDEREEKFHSINVDDVGPDDRLSVFAS